jgi:hypothetical protein
MQRCVTGPRPPVDGLGLRPRLAASLASFGSLRLSIPMSHCYAMLSTDISIALDGIEPREVPAFLTFL